MVGQPFGKWILVTELGRGPVGVVYRATLAEDPTRLACVKVLNHPNFLSPEFAQRFPAEILALHRLTHPNIVQFYEAGVQAGQPWYATEWVDGLDLAQALRSRVKQGQPAGFHWASELLPIAVQLLRALKHGHLRSVLHRSLKPSNVLLTASGMVKITDFGVAKFLAIPPMNQPPDPWGTLGYLAPEAFQGKAYTRKSDLYALGGVLYTLLAGRPPFPGQTAAEFHHKHCYTLPERPIHFAADMAPELDELICHLLAKDPNRRPTSAPAILPALEHIRGKAERKGLTIAWPDDTGGTSAVMPALTQEQIDEAVEERRRPLMSRPLVVLPLFMLVVGLLLALTFWPRATAEELIQAARPLINSDNPADWDQAWEQYLVPLEERFPDQYVEEVQRARRKVQQRRELIRALEAGQRAKYFSEAERLYQRGLRLAQMGELGLAQRTWQQLILAYAGVDNERPWVTLATIALNEIARQPVPQTAPDRTTLLQAIERVNALRQADQPVEASLVLEALHELYEADPVALELLPKR